MHFPEVSVQHPIVSESATAAQNVRNVDASSMKEPDLEALLEKSLPLHLLSDQITRSQIDKYDELFGGDRDYLKPYLQQQLEVNGSQAESQLNRISARRFRARCAPATRDLEQRSQELAAQNTMLKRKNGNLIFENVLLKRMHLTYAVQDTAHTSTRRKSL